MVTAALLQFILSAAGGGVIVAIVNALVNRAKNKADTNKIVQESSDMVFKQLGDLNARVVARLESAEKEILELKRDNDKLSSNQEYTKLFLQTQTEWITKVYAILTPEQRTTVGPPPHYTKTTQESALLPKP